MPQRIAMLPILPSGHRSDQHPPEFNGVRGSCCGL
jgi:hypothetical protein